MENRRRDDPRSDLRRRGHTVQRDRRHPGSTWSQRGRIFTRNGYHVLTAANGPDALALAAGHDGDIHLLVTDVVMPKMLGKEVAERIREFQPDIQVLFMSGYAQPVLASQGRLEPGVALVDKPFSEDALISKAGLVLDGHFPGYNTVGTN